MRLPALAEKGQQFSMDPVLARDRTPQEPPSLRSRYSQEEVDLHPNTRMGPNRPAQRALERGALVGAELDRASQKTLPALCEGGFVERGENLLAFGLPGRGKTHLACALGHELLQHGYRVFFTPTYALVQRLLVAKRDLTLEKELTRLDRFDAVILDDIGYVQQSREEMEVLFTFLAERYERRTVIITSNLVFSEWDRIFKDPMTTAAAIDRLIHHAVILEMNGTSYRTEEAKQRTDSATTTGSEVHPTTTNGEV